MCQTSGRSSATARGAHRSHLLGPSKYESKLGAGWFVESEPPAGAIIFP